MECLFATDLHGNVKKYEKLFKAIEELAPEVVLLGGDLISSGGKTFVREFLQTEFEKLKQKLGDKYPAIFLILGNDDPAVLEPAIIGLTQKGFCEYLHFRQVKLNKYAFYGYAFVPPSPFLLKDWEKYDVSRFVDPGCVSPEEGRRTIEVDKEEVKFSTIEKDLEALANGDDLSDAVMLFHGPPYDTNLDRANLDGKSIDFTPVDVHVGSIAIKKFIEKRQPLITLHGHIHESTQLTGSWQQKIGRTFCFNGAHQGQELSVIIFDPDKPEEAKRLLL